MRYWLSMTRASRRPTPKNFRNMNICDWWMYKKWRLYRKSFVIRKHSPIIASWPKRAVILFSLPIGGCKQRIASAIREPALRYTESWTTTIGWYVPSSWIKSTLEQRRHLSPWFLRLSEHIRNIIMISLTSVTYNSSTKAFNFTTNSCKKDHETPIE